MGTLTASGGDAMGPGTTGITALWRAVEVLEGARSLSTGHPLLLRTLWALVALLALGLPSRADAQTSQTPNFTAEYHHAVLSCHIRLTTDEDGAVVREAIHLPFGERDPKTCLDDFGARDYAAATGRFQTVDPVLPVEQALRDPQQWNRYAYARNNPLIYSDPDGRILRTNAPETILAIAGDAAARVKIVDGVVDTSGLTDADYVGNEGAVWLNKWVTSDNTYTYEEKVFDGGVQNLDNQYDERWTRAPNWADKPPHKYPPADVDAAITVNPTAKYVDEATESLEVTKQAIAFHELVEAYHRVERPYMPYGDQKTYGAHVAAWEPERILMMQRPSWTTYPEGGRVTQKKP